CQCSVDTCNTITHGQSLKHFLVGINVGFHIDTNRVVGVEFGPLACRFQTVEGGNDDAALGACDDAVVGIRLGEWPGGQQPAFGVQVLQPLTVFSNRFGALASAVRDIETDDGEIFHDYAPVRSKRVDVDRGVVIPFYSVQYGRIFDHSADRKSVV